MARVVLDIVCGNESWGALTLELNEQAAPETSRNFLAYVDAGYYDGTIFHRVISHFMVQGGGYSAPEKLKRDGLQSPIQNEAANGLQNRFGSVAMARTSDPHSATSQFFINTGDNDFLDHPGQDGWGYCVFGQVVDGLDLLEKIRGVPVVNNPGMGEKSRPVNPPAIKTARRAAAG
jgi:cyclophilin family peptidyl-prolyl cis-trans isomerase